MISVITPTYAREAMLPFAYRHFAAQTAAELEWIVIDDSPAPSAFMAALADPRVRYHHLRYRSTSGEKRNMAVEMARGDTIVLFDDDDYYAPQYVAAMVDAMRSDDADFVKLAAFFVYSKNYRKFGYCDLRRASGFHFRWSRQPMVGMNISPDDPELVDSHLTYGFSYVFRKHVWGRSKFPPVSFKSDTPFAQSVVSNGARLTLKEDDSGLCLHILHGDNVSVCHLQYILPEPVVKKQLPHLWAAAQQESGDTESVL